MAGSGRELVSITALNHMKGWTLWEFRVTERVWRYVWVEDGHPFPIELFDVEAVMNRLGKDRFDVVDRMRDYLAFNEIHSKEDKEYDVVMGSGSDCEAVPADRA